MPFVFRPLDLLGSVLEILAGAYLLSWTTDGYPIWFTIVLIVVGVELVVAGVLRVLIAAQRSYASRRSLSRDINTV